MAQQLMCIDEAIRLIDGEIMAIMGVRGFLDDGECVLFGNSYVTNSELVDRVHAASKGQLQASYVEVTEYQHWGVRFSLGSKYIFADPGLHMVVSCDCAVVGPRTIGNFVSIGVMQQSPLQIERKFLYVRHMSLMLRMYAIITEY